MDLVDKNHMVISVDTENAFDKIPHAFMMKVPERVGLRGTYANTIKATVAV